MGGLRAGGAQAVVLAAIPDEVDALSVQTLGAYIAAGEGVANAVYSLRLDAMNMPFDTSVGGPVIHHPYYWARWISFTSGETPPKRIEPVYSEASNASSDETENPFGDDDDPATPPTSEAEPVVAPAP